MRSRDKRNKHQNNTTDSPCSVWGHRRTAGLLHDGPLLGLYLILTLGMLESNFMWIYFLHFIHVYIHDPNNVYCFPLIYLFTLK